jgi:GH24 family phage-related lysozyme (muramidase)/LysM repeat protein
MRWLNEIFGNSVSGTASNGASSSSPVAKSSKQPIISASGRTTSANDITASKSISDAQIQRSNYITVTKNPDYKVQSGDNIEKIANKFGVEVRTLLAANGLDKTSGAKLKTGQVLVIPPTKKIKNVKTLSDVAKSMGVSLDFVKRLKKVEDGEGFSENKFHNTPYFDKAGVKTIGIGHAVKAGDPQSLSNSQVCELCAKDLLKVEDNLIAVLGGQKNYDKLPQSLKEALLDMTFNKGTAILEKTDGLIYCLKNGKYEAAINKMTYNKSSTTGEEMSGLSKRRLFDISIAIKMYNGKIPQSNLNTAQQVYNHGIELLRAECKKKNVNFAAQLAGYNNDVKSYLGDKIKLITK